MTVFTGGLLGAVLLRSQRLEVRNPVAAQLAENSLPASCGDDNDVVLTVPARVAQSLVLFQAWLSASLGAEENSRRPPERSNLGESSGKAGGLPHRVAFGENPNRCYFQGNWDFRALVAALYQPTARACAPRHRPLKKKATSRQSVMKCGRLLTKSNKQRIWLATDMDLKSDCWDACWKPRSYWCQSIMEFITTDLPSMRSLLH